MPKYIVSALGDELFLPDDYIFFLNDLQGVTYIRSALATPLAHMCEYRVW